MSLERLPRRRVRSPFNSGAILRAHNINICDGRIHSSNPAFDVYDTSDQYISSDPDAFIRNDLARNPPGRGDD